ncbi:MAG: DUF1697 domain-containing protein [Patescibacteria group bacterium]|nr:DUF1697 domain-containing protein [Patescibacteria group bacterium]
MKYLALLRGINVGGNNLIPMPALRESLTTAGLKNVQTYIQSGNIIFSSDSRDAVALSGLVHETIAHTFGKHIDVVVLSADAWHKIIAVAPKAWGLDPEWKHNLLVLLNPDLVQQVVDSIGAIIPNIELLKPGEGILYQSVSFADYGKSATSKLAKNPFYKKMTIRNYNTAAKLNQLLQAEAE